jgi:hypothetical protein
MILLQPSELLANIRQHAVKLAALVKANPVPPDTPAGASTAPPAAAGPGK